MKTNPDKVFAGQAKRIVKVSSKMSFLAAKLAGNKLLGNSERLKSAVELADALGYDGVFAVSKLCILKSGIL